jgi:SAM-dependent methyltransferase
MNTYFSRRGSFYEKLYASRDNLSRFQTFWYQPYLQCLRYTIAALGDVREKRILDVGCGTGIYSLTLAEMGAEVVALDVCQEMISMAQRHAQERRLTDQITFVNTGFLEWSDQAGDQFHASIVIGVFDYVVQPSLWLSQLAVKSSHLIASFPSFNFFFSPLRQLRYRWLGVQYRLYRESETLALLDQTGFQVRRILSNRQGFWVHARRKDNP